MTRKAKSMPSDFSALTGVQAARALGCSSRTITRWFREGCPRNSDKSYSLPDLLTWAIDRAQTQAAKPTDDAESKKWLTAFRRERAKLTEMERRKMEGELIEVAEVEKQAFDCARAVRDAILNVPARTSAVLAAETDQLKVEKILNNELVQALEELSNGGIIDG